MDKRSISKELESKSLGCSDGTRDIITVSNSTLFPIVNGTRRTVVMSEFDNDEVSTFGSIDEACESPFITVASSTFTSDGVVYDRNAEILRQRDTPS
jgi:hypothetical protein